MKLSIGKIFVKKVLGKVFGVQILRNPHRGIELYCDIEEYLPDFVMRTIFDVGANTGSSAIDYKQWYPSAQVHCFEPASSTFAELKRNTVNINGICLERVALGAMRTVMQMSTNESESYLNRVEEISEISERTGPTEEIEVSTVDHYCEELVIEHIDLLKIDTEGFDEAVLQGASRMLASGSIKLIQVECGMNPGNNWHVPFERLKSFLETSDYLLFGIYEQIGEWKTSQPHLRRVNAVFISRALT